MASGVSSVCASTSGGIHPSAVMRTRKPHSLLLLLDLSGLSVSPHACTHSVSPDAVTFCQRLAAAPSKRATSCRPASSVQKRRCAEPLSSERASICTVSCAAPGRWRQWRPLRAVPFRGCSDWSVTVPLSSRLRCESASSRSSRGSALNGPGSCDASDSGFIRLSISVHSFANATEPDDSVPELPDE